MSVIINIVLINIVSFCLGWVIVLYRVIKIQGGDTTKIIKSVKIIAVLLIGSVVLNLVTYYWLK